MRYRPHLILSGFISIDRSTLPDRQGCCFQSEIPWTTSVLDYKCFGCFHGVMTHIELAKQIPEANDFARWYYQPRQIPTTAWTASITWYTRSNLACIKITQNFFLSLLFESEGDNFTYHSRHTWESSESFIKRFEYFNILNVLKLSRNQHF